MNESRDPDRGLDSDRYTARLAALCIPFLKEVSRKKHLKMLIENETFIAVF